MKSIRSFVRTWTMELKDRKIRANVIGPGTIDTPILAGLPKAAIGPDRRLHSDGPYG